MVVLSGERDRIRGELEVVKGGFDFLLLFTLEFFAQVFSGITHIALRNNRGAWVAQSVKCRTLAQVMISRLVSTSPAVSAENASDPVSLSAPPPLILILSLSKIN